MVQKTRFCPWCVSKHHHSGARLLWYWYLYWWYFCVRSQRIWTLTTHGYSFAVRVHTASRAATGAPARAFKGCWSEEQKRTRFHRCPTAQWRGWKERMQADNLLLPGLQSHLRVHKCRWTQRHQQVVQILEGILNVVWNFLFLVTAVSNERVHMNSLYVEGKPQNSSLLFVNILEPYTARHFRRSWSRPKQN